MLRALKLPPNESSAAFHALQKALGESVARRATEAQNAKKYGGPSEPIVLAVANRLFPQKGFVLRPEFLAEVQANFGAPPEPLDFKANAASATRRINQWVAEQTRERIENLIPSPLDEQTRLVLVNALYFKAPWAHEFSKSATEPELFQINGETPAKVPMMRKVLSLGYAQGDGYTSVALPYAGEEFQLLILLPNEKNGLGALEKKLEPGIFAAGAKLPGVRVDLHLPRFKFSPETLELSRHLQAMGLQAMFDLPQGSADFSRMAERKPDEYLYISDVFHKTFVAVDEQGTEAAAATAAVMMATTAAPGQDEPVEVKVDRPFLYAIQHVPSGVCLFLGRVTDPR